MTPTAAANAYATMANSIASATQSPNAGGALTTGQSSPGGFADMMQQAMETTSAQLQQADQVSAQAVAGNADLVDVVTAISETEMTIETIVGLRDRVIGAYEQIMRMPI